MIKIFYGLLALASCAQISYAAPSGISGKIKLAPEMKSKISQTAVLYIIARPVADPGSHAPTMPLAVKRITQPFTFPMDFTIGQADAMMPNTTFEGKLTISARISQSGSATPVKAGDIEAAQPTVIEVGQKSSGRVIELNHFH
ncbi:MAG: hypothetical protein H7222_03675 [Methylotenera sp.]|nr:hypothetical protein [Oligoflexia bacterium]